MRRPRGLWAAMVVALYLCVGAFHAVAHADDAAARSAVTVVMTLTSAADSGAAAHGIVADHHCHGCLSVTLPVPAATPALAVPFATPALGAIAGLPDALPRLDTPPPRSMT